MVFASLFDGRLLWEKAARSTRRYKWKTQHGHCWPPPRGLRTEPLYTHRLGARGSPMTSSVFSSQGGMRVEKCESSSSSPSGGDGGRGDVGRVGGGGSSFRGLYCTAAAAAWLVAWIPVTTICAFVRNEVKRGGKETSLKLMNFDSGGNGESWTETRAGNVPFSEYYYNGRERNLYRTKEGYMGWTRFN